VILLENSNKWNLFPAKRTILEKKGARIEKQKRSYEEIHVTKKRG
jgi:hypothetical protein